jgi:hypothetical protein
MMLEAWFRFEKEMAGSLGGCWAVFKAAEERKMAAGQFSA